jgi:hypothetical protein
VIAIGFWGQEPTQLDSESGVCSCFSVPWSMKHGEMEGFLKVLDG